MRVDHRAELATLPPTMKRLCILLESRSCLKITWKYSFPKLLNSYAISPEARGTGGYQYSPLRTVTFQNRLADLRSWRLSSASPTFPKFLVYWQPDWSRGVWLGSLGNGQQGSKGGRKLDGPWGSICKTARAHQLHKRDMKSPLTWS